MLKSNARAIWLFSNIRQPKIEIKKILIIGGVENKQFPGKAKKIEIKITLKSPNLDHSNRNVEIRIETSHIKNKKNNKDEDKKERLSNSTLILNKLIVFNCIIFLSYIQGFDKLDAFVI